MNKKLKIAFAASAGGHLSQIEKIFTKEVTGDIDEIFLTEENEKTKKLAQSKKFYFFNPLGYNPIRYFFALLKCIKLFKKEKVDMIITTGAEIGLVSVIAGKFLGKKTVFIDTVIRVKTPTLAGKMSYPFSDVFLVQNPGMERLYGKRAKYRGGII